MSRSETASQVPENNEDNEISSTTPKETTESNNETTTESNNNDGSSTAQESKEERSGNNNESLNTPTNSNSTTPKETESKEERSETKQDNDTETKTSSSGKDERSDDGLNGNNEGGSATTEIRNIDDSDSCYGSDSETTPRLETSDGSDSDWDGNKNSNSSEPTGGLNGGTSPPIEKNLAVPIRLQVIQTDALGVTLKVCVPLMIALATKRQK